VVTDLVLLPLLLGFVFLVCCGYRPVTVLLQAMKEDPPAGSKCKDKFLVQSTFITPEKENLPLQELVSRRSFLLFLSRTRENVID
jgi:hypothetical protein